MRSDAMPGTIWANMPPPNYLVRIPEGSEPVYEWAAPVSLALAAVFAGGWVLRARSLKTGRARAWLWAAAGCLAIAFSAAWVWANRTAAPSPDLMARAANWMPWIWAAGCGIVVYWYWPRVRGLRVDPGRVDEKPPEGPA